MQSLSVDAQFIESAAPRIPLGSSGVSQFLRSYLILSGSSLLVRPHRLKPLKYCDEEKTERSSTEYLPYRDLQQVFKLPAGSSSRMHSPIGRLANSRL